MYPFGTKKDRHIRSFRDVSGEYEFKLRKAAASLVREGDNCEAVIQIANVLVHNDAFFFITPGPIRKKLVDLRAMLYENTIAVVGKIYKISLMQLVEMLKEKQQDD